MSCSMLCQNVIIFGGPIVILKQASVHPLQNIWASLHGLGIVWGSSSTVPSPPLPSCPHGMPVASCHSEGMYSSTFTIQNVLQYYRRSHPKQPLTTKYLQTEAVTELAHCWHISGHGLVVTAQHSTAQHLLR